MLPTCSLQVVKYTELVSALESLAKLALPAVSTPTTTSPPLEGDGLGASAGLNPKKEV